VLSDYLGDPMNEAREEADLIAYLDGYYAQYNPIVPTAATIMDCYEASRNNRQRRRTVLQSVSGLDKMLYKSLTTFLARIR
jgi:hypothetical protein